MTALALLSCGTSRKNAVQPSENRPAAAEETPRSRDADDAGRFLAGLPGSPGTSFAGLEKEKVWKDHRRELDRAWRKIDTGSIPAMREFQKSELSGTPIPSVPVFYPFSGPDSLMLTVLFPRNPVYVMVGLEPPGTLPTPKQFAKKNLGRPLKMERDTVYSELQRSFFITRQMDRQFRGQVTDGLFVPILHLLVRTGNTILGYRYVQLDEAGRVVARTVPSAEKTPPKGLEISFQAADGSVHKLFYFSLNLADEKLKQDKPFLAYLASLKGVATFLKATSYMTHRDEFSVIREQVLANSVAVLQDDSGIPYRFFDTKVWNVQLYGMYNRPYGSFRWLTQPDLKKAYDTSQPKPLGFRMGYGYSRIPSNLLFAKRAGTLHVS
ncbi:MAG TPA: hypothetical protein VKU01_15120 [Bryobacteraceae bacterium]|nr:hypothetical protein [Bryobacteraceae bacterium]